MAGQNMCAGVALGTVGVQELTGKVNDGLAVPDLAHPLLLGHGGNDGRLKVFLGGVLHKGLGILGSHGYSHALLALGNRQLGAVQTLVFAGDLVQVDVQAVSKLADGNGHTARTEVIAASRPVRPPSRMTTSPGAGSSRRTWLAGVAPTTAPISMRLAA